MILKKKKMKKMMNQYNHTAINELDKRLLRGLFMKKIRDFDEEQRDKAQSQTLMSKLKKDRDIILNEADFGGDTEIQNQTGRGSTQGEITRIGSMIKESHPFMIGGP